MLCNIQTTYPRHGQKTKVKSFLSIQYNSKITQEWGSVVTCIICWLLKVTLNFKNYYTWPITKHHLKLTLNAKRSKVERNLNCLKKYLYLEERTGSYHKMLSNFSKQIFTVTFKAKKIGRVHTDGRQSSVQWGRKSRTPLACRRFYTL